MKTLYIALFIGIGFLTSCKLSDNPTESDDKNSNKTLDGTWDIILMEDTSTSGVLKIITEDKTLSGSLQFDVNPISFPITGSYDSKNINFSMIAYYSIEEYYFRIDFKGTYNLSEGSMTGSAAYYNDDTGEQIAKGIPWSAAKK